MVVASRVGTDGHDQNKEREAPRNNALRDVEVRFGEEDPKCVPRCGHDQCE